MTRRVRWLMKQHACRVYCQAVWGATLAANIEFGQMSLLIGLLLHVIVFVRRRVSVRVHYGN